MSATSAQKKAYRKQIGKELKVRFPDGGIIHAWQLWEKCIHSSDPASDYLSAETDRIVKLYEKHAPEMLPALRLRRALKMALKLASFDVLGSESDEADLRVLALASGLKEGDFEVVNSASGPMFGLNVKAMQQLGVSNLDSTTMH